MLLTFPSPSAIAVFVAAVAYVLFHVGAVHLGPFRARRGWWRRLWAIPWLLGVPLVLIAALDLPPPELLGLNLTHLDLSLGLTGAALLVMAPLIYFQSKKAAFRRFYPEVRLELWTGADHAKNALTWAAYLFAYEFYFRGFLLVLLALQVGPMLALAIVTMVYAFAHIDKNPGELIGTLISGVGFGLGVLATGSILMPFLTHVGIAVMTDIFASRPPKTPSDMPGAA